MFSIYCDGGARGNPGPAGIGFVASKNGQEVMRFSKFIGTATNNVAEYTAVIEALKWLGRRGPATFYLDSELVTRQLNRVYKIKNEALKKLSFVVKALERKAGQVTYLHVPRGKNKTADALVNAAIDTSTSLKSTSTF